MHRNILAAHSDTLRAAFDHQGFTEAFTGVYTIAEGDINPQILEDVLKWMYFFNIPNASERADALLDAAEYFQMAGLREMCGRLLVDQLKVLAANSRQYIFLLQYIIWKSLPSKVLGTEKSVALIVHFC